MSGGIYTDDVGGHIEPDDFTSSREKEEKQRALHEPGAPWKEWLYFTAFKWWIGIVFLIVDSWIVTIFLEVREWIFLGLAVAGAIYLEYLLYAYLWRRPDHSRPPEEGGIRWPPFEIGRWTPEAFAERAGTSPAAGSDQRSPNPRDFL